jgi:hypothetical protein
MDLNISMQTDFRRVTKGKAEAGPPLCGKTTTREKSKTKAMPSNMAATALTVMFVLDWLWFVSI